jgi:hypothetical protein
MNIASNLPTPLNRFVVDVPENTYYDFELEPNSTYPLNGVTYPVDYGNIPGYTAEDGHALDLFVGSKFDGEAGYIVVNRGDKIPDEHKFYVALTKSEINKVLRELKPVLLEHKKFNNFDDLLKLIRRFKDKN